MRGLDVESSFTLLMSVSADPLAHNIELKLKILLSMPDIQTLESLIRASPSYRAV